MRKQKKKAGTAQIEMVFIMPDHKEPKMTDAWRCYQLTYIERDLGLTGDAAEALLPERARAARYVQQFTKARHDANAKDMLWNEFS